MNIGYLRVVIFCLLSMLCLLCAATAHAQTIKVAATGPKTFSITLNNVYSWRIEELVGTSWVTFQTGQGTPNPLSFTREKGTYKFKLYNCYSAPNSCSNSATQTVTLEGDPPPANPTISATLNGPSIIVNWSASAGATSYQLTRDGSLLNSSGNSYTDSNVSGGASYIYTVKACSAVGCSSGVSAYIGYPSVPATPQLTAVLNGGSVTLGWNTPANTVSFKLKRGSLLLTQSGTSYIDPGIAAGNSYTYTLQACNSAGLCSNEASATIVVPPIPAVPTVTINFKGASIELSWGAISGAVRYSVVRDGGGSLQNDLRTNFIDKNINPGATYNYYVYACNSNNQCSSSIKKTVQISNGPLLQVDALQPNTINILVGGVYSWRVEEEKSPGSWTTVKSGAAGDPKEFSLTRPGGRHTFRLYNCFPDGNCGTSGSPSVTLQGSPPPPVPVLKTKMSGTSVLASWDPVAGAASYVLTRAGISSITLTGTSYTDNQVTPGTAYTYTLTACGTTGDCSAASMSSITPPPIPVKPTNLEIQINSQIKGVKLSWTAPSGTYDYRVRRGTGAALTISESAYTDTAISSGNTYSYVVTACNSVGQCSPEATISITLAAIPATPTNLFSGIGEGKLDISWGASANASSYRLSRSDGVSLTPTGTSYADRSVVAGTSYTYSVSACNALGDCSAAASTTITYPPIPAAPELTALMNGTSVKLSWNVPAHAFKYQLARGTDLPQTLMETVYYDSLVVAGNSYSYTLQACNRAGLCSGGATATIEVTPVPAAPEVTATFKGASIELSWGAINGAVKYSVVRDGSSLQNDLRTNFIDKNINPGATYNYYVYACNSNNQCSSSIKKTVQISNGPLLQVDALQPNTINILVGGVYSWRVEEEKSPGSWTTVKSGAAGDPKEFSLTRPGGRHTFRLYNCFPDGNCGTSGSPSVTLQGSPPPPVPVLKTKMSGTSVLASWDPVAGAASYVLTRAGISSITLTGTSYTDNQVTPGTAYTYTLTACGTTGDCSAASMSSITPPPIPVKPTNLEIQINSQIKGVKLSWTAPSGTYDYRVRRGTGAALTISESAYTDTAISSGNTYSYVVTACNSVGQCSPEATISITLAAIPATPTNLFSGIGEGKLDISWGASANASSYRLSRSDGVSLTPTGTSYADRSVVAGTSYTYSVSACNALGDCSAAASTTITYPPIPAAPELTALMNGTSVKLSWNVPAHAFKYQLARGTDLPQTLMETVYYDSLVVAGNSYSYTLQACNRAGLCSGGATATIEVTPVPAAPEVTATFKGASIELSWGAINGAVKYSVVRDGSSLQNDSRISFIDKNINPGATYIYYVYACNNNNQCSSSIKKTVQISNGPLFQVDAVQPSTIDIVVVGVYSWYVEEEVSPGSWSRVAATGDSKSFSLTRPGGRHTFRLYNCFPDGVCQTSSTPSVVLDGPPPPATPTINAEFNGTSVEVSWSNSEGAQYFQLKKDGLLLVPVGASYSDPFVVPGTSYRYSVAACKSEAEGGCSEAASVSISIPRIPSVPVISARMSGASVYVRWDPVADAKSYRLVKGESQPLMHSGTAYTDPQVSPGGTYNYSVVACNEAKVCSGAGTASITVRTEQIADVMVSSPLLNNASDAADPADRAKPTEAPIGSLAGEFRVNEMGAATYTVPIAIPDGIAGVTPQLSLMYSSQGGNGLLGKGWALNGLSGITRCRQTLIQDGQAAAIAWNSGDRFCLDGKRLMLVNSSSAVYGDPNTVYKTEIDSFVTVRAVGGTAGNPDYFSVSGKDGSVSSYGGVGSDPSELLTTKGVLTWGIKTFSDSVSNPIAFDYEGGTTNYRISKIRYAISDRNSASSTCGAFVSFAYEPRTSVVADTTLNDDQSAYIAGVEIKNTQRLASISAYNGACSAESATLSRIYKISYDPGAANYPHAYVSQIDSISECVNATTCYPATTFDWNNPGEGRNIGTDIGSVMLGSGSLGGSQFLDINGNGMADMVWSNGGGTWSASYALDVGAKSGLRTVKTITSATYSDTSGKNPPRFLPIDYNGDSRQDLLVYTPTYNDAPQWRLHLSTPTSDGWVLRQQQSITLPFATQKYLHVADINSDGLSEVIGFYPLNSGLKVYSLVASDAAEPSSSTLYSFNEGGFYGFTDEPADDLEPDVEADNSLTFADFNGDGKMDVAVRYKGKTGGSTINQSAYRVYVANNNYQFSYYATLDTPTAGYGHVIDKIIAADINGDGLADTAYFLGKITCVDTRFGRFCEPDEGDWYYRLNTGDGFASAVKLANTPDDVVFADINHDGKMDFVSSKKQAQNASYKDINVQYWDSATNNLTAAEELMPDQQSGKNFQFVDTNGDSWVDAVYMEVVNSQIKMTTLGYSGGSVRGTPFVSSDQIYKVTDGLGNVTDITYAPLARSTNYSPIGDIKITAESYQRCHGEIVNPYGAGSGTIPAGCEAATRYDIDTEEFYTQINSPFQPLIDADQINSLDLISSPVMEVIGPVTLVGRVETSAPSTSSEQPGNVDGTAKNSVDYFYRHLRMQAGGRGMLGFESLITVDAQSGVKTETRYRQDWPYIGSPLETIVQAGDKKLLSRATNSWNRRMVDGSNNVDGENINGRRYQPYIEQSVEETFAYNSDGSGTTINAEGEASGSALQTVTTETVMSDDDYGNVTSLVVTTTSGADTLVKSTVNEFSGSEWEKRMGRMESSTITTTRNEESDSARTVNFTYYAEGTPENGLLWTESVSGAENEALVTTYTYDTWGNKSQVSVVGSGQTRNAYSNYGDTGRYLVSSTNDLQQASQITGRDPATGQVSNITDTNGVTAEVLYDDMGKEYLRVDASGAWTRIDTTNCSAGACPAGARFKTHTRVSGGGESAVYYDTLGRAIRTAKVGFDGTWIYVDTEYDNLGRVKHQSTPYFANSSPAGWTTTTYDILGRIRGITMPDGSTSSSTFSATTAGMETTTTNGLNQTQTELRNGLGQLLSVTDYLGGTVSYTYNVKGDLLTATTDDSPSASPNVEPVTVSMCYDSLGRKIGMYDPDKGGFVEGGSADCSQISTAQAGTYPAGWWLYTYNAFGELVSQRDPKGQETIMIYDTLGRMIFRRESKAPGQVGIEAATTWVFDKPLEGEAQAGTIGKVTAMIVKYTRGGSGLSGPAGKIDCGNTNYCTQIQYDELGRPEVTLTHFPDGQDHITTIDYDSIGRAYQSTDVLQSVFSSSGIQTQFNDYGYAYRTVDLATMNGADSALSTIRAMNARGQVTEELRSNGAITTNTYNEATGLLEGQEATVTGLMSIQDNSYEWDALGNLKFRASAGAKIGSQQLKSKEEGFCYDGLNRLIAILPTRNPACSGASQIEYDGLGNITKKQGVGDYEYDRSNGGPHAVTSVNGNPYRYDLNGNAVSGDGRTFEYTSYDMVKKITKGLDSVEFKYGPDHARWQRIDVKNGVTTTTTYLGNIERIATSTSDIVEWKRTVAGVVHTYKTLNLLMQPSGYDKRYLYTDHLGSVDAVTDVVGNVTHSMSFDAWGARRSGEDWAAITAAQIAQSLSLTGFDQPLTTRGYTGHEMVDDFGIIHMNGRIYDARIGRFLQADPFIQAASNTQSYNRYSYVMNNPLNSTDPSGYFSLRKFVGVIVAAVMTYFGCPSCGKATYAIITGVVAGGAQAAANGQNIFQGMMFGAVSAAAFYGVGQAFSAGGQTFGSADALTKLKWAASQGAVGGTLSVMQGGKFGHGFSSAFVTKYANVNDIVGTAAEQAGTRVMLAAIIGGTVSEMTGGKFANGAASAALMQAVNGENEAAQKRYRDRFVLGRISVTTSVDQESGSHEYRIRGLICNTSSASCNTALADSVYEYVNANDVPFTQDDLNVGRHFLKPNLGLVSGFIDADPITHTQNTAQRTSVNVAEEGHRFYPGSVVHRVHFEGENLYYDLIGVGTGDNPNFNNFVGVGLFRPGVATVVRQFGF